MIGDILYDLEVVEMMSEWTSANVMQDIFGVPDFRPKEHDVRSCLAYVVDEAQRILHRDQLATVQSKPTDHCICSPFVTS